MRNDKILLIGNCAFKSLAADGQTVKTRTIYYGLQKYYKTKLVVIDTSEGNYLYTILKFICLSIRCKRIIILPAQKLLSILPYFCIFPIVVNKTKLHYIVIGGWLPKFLESHIVIRKILAMFDNIYVETNTVKNLLSKICINNVTILNNCRDYNPVIFNAKKNSTVVKFCFYSRVMEEKGIEDVIISANRLNSLGYEDNFILNIYGPILKNYSARFHELIKEFPANITYKGIVPYEDAHKILADNDVLVFPTHFFTEGIPGSIIDAFFAGIPAIVASWESVSDVVEHNVTGLIYKFNDLEGLMNCMEKFIIHPTMLQDMHKSVIKKAREYTSEFVIGRLIDCIGGI